jgi:hypothetical protein
MSNATLAPRTRRQKDADLNQNSATTERLLAESALFCVYELML